MVEPTPELALMRSWVDKGFGQLNNDCIGAIEAFLNNPNQNFDNQKPQICK